MATSQGQEHGVSEDQSIVRSPLPHVLRTYLSPSSARSSEVGQSRRRLRSPIIPVVRSPVLRMYLSPSFGRSMNTRQRNSPTARASSPSVVMSPANVHTSVDIAAVRRSSNDMTFPAGAHTSAHASSSFSRSRKRKLTSDIWDDFTAIFDEIGAAICYS